MTAWRIDRHNQVPWERSKNISTFDYTQCVCVWGGKSVHPIYGNKLDPSFIAFVSHRVRCLWNRHQLVIPRDD